MRSTRRSKNKLMNQINVVPYIDVMLVLLVIFMVTAPMMTPGQVDLPQLGSSSQPSVAPMEVTLKKDLSLEFRDHATGGAMQEVDQASLIELLQQKQAEHPDQAVVISADKKVPYEEVIKVMDILQQQQIKKIGLLTQIRK